MDVLLKISFFLFLLSAAKGQSQTSTKDYQKNLKFHADQHNYTRHVLKSEIGKYVSNLTTTNLEILSKLETLTKMERKQKELSANLSLGSIGLIESLFRNLSDSFNKGLSGIELKMETFLRNLTEPVEAKRPKESQTEVIQAAQQSMQTEVEEVNAEEGTIEFVGRSNLHLRRKIWVLRSKRGNYFRLLRFLLEDNGLTEDARLSLWGSRYEGGDQHLWTETQPNWREKREVWGHVILVTLLIPPGGAETPSFKLKFTTTRPSINTNFGSEVLRGEGRQVVSFPPNNTHNYSPESQFVALVAAPSGRSFGLTLTFLDLPCNDNFFGVYFLEESPTGEPYKLLTSSTFTRCGSVNGILDSLGNFTVAIIQFRDFGEGRVGRGFRLEIN